MWRYAWGKRRDLWFVKGKDSHLYKILEYEKILNALKNLGIFFRGLLIHSFIYKYLLRPRIFLNAKNTAVNQISPLSELMFLLCWETQWSNRKVKHIVCHMVTSAVEWRGSGLWEWETILNSAWGKVSVRRWHLRKIKGDEANCIALWENSISWGSVFQTKETASAKVLR